MLVVLLSLIHLNLVVTFAAVSNNVIPTKYSIEVGNNQLIGNYVVDERPCIYIYIYRAVIADSIMLF